MGDDGAHRKEGNKRYTYMVITHRSNFKDAFTSWSSFELCFVGVQIQYLSCLFHESVLSKYKSLEPDMIKRYEVVHQDGQ